MAVKLRLRRMGKKKQPIYKVVAADARSPRDGKFIESIGLYNPLTDPSIVEIKEDRALYWLDKGAQPTNTVKSLLRQKGIILKRELIRKGLSEEEIKQGLENWEKLHEAKIKSVALKEEKSDENVQKGNIEQEIEINEKSTAEVKGAASGEDSGEKEEK